MPINGIAAFGQGLTRNFQQVGTDFEKRVDEIALNAAALGEQAVHETINNTASSLSPGKPDRNWTWTMNRSATSDVKQRGRKRTLQVGWLKVKEAYFLIQEDGGTVNGRTVTPMHALVNAFTAMTGYIEREMSRLKTKR